MQISRESVFVSALRSLFTSFAVMMGILIGIIVIFFVVGSMSGTPTPTQTSNIEILRNADGSNKVLPASAPVILRLDVTGVIGTRDLTGERFQNLLYDSRDGFFKKDRVKGILLYVDTPGGTTVDSDAIYRALESYKEKYKVPIFAYVPGLCASGGMYVTSACDKIFASPESIIGSIGVRFGPMFNVSQLMQRYGIEARTLTQGKDKDMLNPFRPWKQGEDESLVTIMKYSYDHFVDVVTSTRPRVNKELLINEYGAQVYDAPTAEKIGYIDAAGSSYLDTLNALVREANLEGEDYQVVQLKPYRSVFSDLREESSALLQGKIKHELNLEPYHYPELQNKLLYFYESSLCD